HEFAHASPGRIERLQQGTVTLRSSCLIGRKLHQRCCVVLGQDTWKMFRLFRRPDGLGWIQANHALSLKITIETTKGSELPGHRRGFLMLAVQPVKVVPNRFRLHRGGIKYASGLGLLRHKRLKLSEVR